MGEVDWSSRLDAIGGTGGKWDRVKSDLRFCDDREYHRLNVQRSSIGGDGERKDPVRVDLHSLHRLPRPALRLQDPSRTTNGRLAYRYAEIRGGELGVWWKMPKSKAP